MGIYEIIKGELRAEVSGAYPESVINAAAKYGIELKKVERLDETTVLVSFPERDREKMDAIAQKCMCDMRIVRVRGGSRTRGMIKRRRLLITLLVMFTALVHLSSLFIWEIDVSGNETLSRGEILRALSDAGVDCGTYWPKLSVDIIRSKTISALPEIGWMAVNVSGSRAVVRIQERKEKPEIYAESASADIVAGKTGIVRRVSVLSGNTLVTEGDAVTAGEKLVSGIMDSICGDARFVRAKGNILADTWYELSAVCPSEELQKIPCGISGSRYALVVGKRRINLYPDSGKTIDECDKIIHEYKLGAEGLFSMPVKLIREQRQRYKTSSEVLYDSTQMKRKLTDTLRQSVAGEINSMSFREGNLNGVYVLTLRAHCTEQIGETVPLRE